MVSREPAHWGGGAHLGIPYPQMAERRAAVAAISMVTAGVEARSWTDPGALLASRGPDDGVARTLCAPTSSLSMLAAGQGRRQPIKGGGTNKGGVDSKAVFLRPRPGGGALADAGVAPNAVVSVSAR